MCLFINNVNKTIDANNIPNICRNISHTIYVQSPKHTKYTW